MSDLDVLIIGGTSMARALASQLSEHGIRVTTSLAGRTSAPRSVSGAVRMGGFGGVEGLIGWLGDHQPRCVVNASHPFAATMSSHAARACQRLGLPMARLTPRSWGALTQARDWIWVADNPSAAQAVVALPDPVLLTVGRQATADYLALGDRDVTHRVIDAPVEELPPRWTLVRQRGPFTMADEQSQLDAPGHRIATLVTKDSGGDSPAAKLSVAARTGARVVMIARPASPDYGTAMHDLAQARSWVRMQLRSTGSLSG